MLARSWPLPLSALIPLLGALSLIGCGSNPSAGPTPDAFTSPTPPEGSATPSASPAETVSLKVEVYDTQGSPWAGARVFAGLDGRGPSALTDGEGRTTLPVTAGAVTLSIFHTYTTRYSQADTYTVNRINTYPPTQVDGPPEAPLAYTLFRDVDWRGNPPVIATLRGEVSGIDVDVPASRIFVQGGDDTFEGGASAEPLSFDLASTEALGFVYAAQVPIDPEGVYGPGRIPLAFELVLDPGGTSQDLALTRTFSEAISLSYSGVDPLATALQEAYRWTLPHGAGALEIYDATYATPEDLRRMLPLPPEDPAWAGDVLDLRAAALGSDRIQVVEGDAVSRGGSLALAFHPVPRVQGRSPLSSPSLPGARFEVGEVTGAESILFYFSERWFRRNGTYGGFDLVYDLYNVVGTGADGSLTVPVAPPGVPWPSALGSAYLSLDREAYVQSVFTDGRSRRALEVIPPVP